MSWRAKTTAVALALAALSVLLLTPGFRSERAPEVALTLVNEDPAVLSDLHDGQPLLVVFWATDCAQCVREVPTLVELYDRYHGRGLNLVAVAMAHDPPSRVWDFMRDNTIPYRVSLDLDRRVASAFGGVDVTPTLFLIDGMGTIVLRHTGKLQRQRLEASIRGLLPS